MGHTYIKDLARHVGEDVTLKGWLYNLRSSGKLLFPQLRDGTGIVQGVVAKNSVSPELWDALKPLGQESALIVTGRVRADSRAPGGFEIDVTDAQVVQNAHDGRGLPGHFVLKISNGWRLLSLRKTPVEFFHETCRFWSRDAYCPARNERFGTE